MLLAIDTATRLAGIALYDELGLHAEELWRTGDNHTAELMPNIVRICDQSGVTPTELEAIGVSLGPGSFTGLRVGLAVAKGLALALEVPILGVPTLDVTAYPHRHQPLPVCAVLPAGRQRLCVAWYGPVRCQQLEQRDYLLISSNQLLTMIQEPTLVCGELEPALVQDLQREGASPAVIATPATALRRAGYLAELAWKRLFSGEVDDVASLSPIYPQSL